jgi:hypothetical protein
MRFSVNSGQVISEIIDGEAVMINLTTGNYYSLNPAGAAIWDALEAGASDEEIVHRLAARYDASQDELAAAVTHLLEELRREELVVPAEQNGAPPAPASPEPGSSRAAFEPPRLEKHSDMQDLILLDPVHEVDERGWPHAPERA